MTEQHESPQNNKNQSKKSKKNKSGVISCDPEGLANLTYDSLN